MITTNTKKTILNGLVGNSNAFGGSAFLGLSSTAPKEDGTEITEPTVGGYARVQIGSYNSSGVDKFGSPEVDAETGNLIVANNTEIYFPESTASWGNALTHFVIFSAKTGGNVIAYGELTDDGVPAPITVDAEKTVVMFRPGKLKITFAD